MRQSYQIEPRLHRRGVYAILWAMSIQLNGGAMTDKDQKYADKIAKLLAKAEDTDNPAEAEIFTAKAQELMTQYAISEQMIREQEGKPREEIVEEYIVYGGTYGAAHARIGQNIGEANNCKLLWGQASVEKPLKTDPTRTRYVNATKLYVIGFESDVARVKLLDTSLQIQATIALTGYVKDGGLEGLWDNNDKTRARRDFIEGFASGLGQKLRAARSKGEEEAAHEEAERTGVTEDEASESVALVIRSRKDQVQDWYDEKWGGRVRKSRASYRRYGSYGARSAGHSAGMSANTSSNNLRGSGGALGSGS